MPPRFGTDGLRGVANVDLTPELALALGRASARHLPGETFLIGEDTRRSGAMLKAALASGITSEGGSVLDVGVVPTPGLAWLAAERHVPGAMISASHNPFSDNGIKLLSSAGTKLPVEVEAAIEAELDALLGAGGPAVGVRGGAIGQITVDRSAGDAYAEHLVAAGSEGAGRRVVCDCANGASSFIAPAVLKRLGFDVIVLAASPNGTNINEGCGSTHPEAAQAAVIESKASAGLCFDGDADRLIAIDEKGNLVDGDELLALFALDLKARGELDGDAVVLTVMSNLGLRRALADNGIEVVETPLGDRFVADAIEQRRLALGGEQSGHLIFARHATTGDGMLTGLMLLDLLGRSTAPLSQLAAAAMTRLPQELRTIHVPDPAFLADANAIWKEVACVQEDLAGSGRVLVRASGTESAVRVMVEAESTERASAALGRIVTAIERELSSSPG